MTASSDANGTENLDQVSQISSGDEPATWIIRHSNSNTQNGWMCLSLIET